MANTDVTRSGEFAQKKGICVFAGDIVEGTNLNEGQIPAATGNFLIGKLPPDAVITNAYVHVITAGDAATSASAKLGTAEGGSQVLSAANLKTLGKQGTFTGQVHTDTGVDLYLGLTITGAATDVAHYVTVVEYLEYQKNTGEYTRFN
tara:strand:+ start:4314 stop:4757 length:444 start_codon:yes stop_codon:yes gene_type:complete